MVTKRNDDLIIVVMLWFLSLLLLQSFKPISAVPGTNTLFGTDASDGNLLTINPTSGAGTIVGNMGAGSIPSLAVDPNSGLIYAGGGASAPNIYTIDAITGAATLIGDTGLGFATVSGLDFNSGGTLFASVNIAGDGGTGADHLATINKSTGAATVIGSFGTCIGVSIPSSGAGSCSIEGMEAIAFDSSGILYGATSSIRGSQTPTLYMINTATGQATMVAPILDGSGAAPSGGIVSLQFACDRTLFGGTARAVSPATDGGDLVTIDSNTGVFSTVGKATTGTSLGALAFQAVCPGTSAVGGEILPIDMTSLVVAGALTSSPYWLVPIIAVGVVIALRARMRKNTKESF